MRIKNKNEFGDLSTAVIYSFNKFLPDPESNDIQDRLVDGFKEVLVNDLNSYRASRVSYHGGTKRFDNIDFAEYDFSYILENQKFNNKDLISYLVDEDRNEIGFNLGSLEKVNAALFPTIEENGTESAYDYFGSLVLSTATIYLFNLDPLYYKIELYEDYIESNNSLGGFIDSDYLKLLKMINPDDPDKLLVEPVVTIYLGPEDKYKDNPGYMYYQADPYSYNRTEVYDETGVGYSKLYDEIYSGKAVWLALAPDNSIKQLNLSYNAWLNSEDANRYKHLHNLRNDDYYGSDKFEIIKRDKDTNFLSDVRSGKLLGTQILMPSKEVLPILHKKVESVNESIHTGLYIDWDPSTPYTQGEYTRRNGKYYIAIDNNSGKDPEVDTEYWNPTDREPVNYIPEVEYEVGRVVKFDNDFYVAIKPGNRGRRPSLSSFWVLRDKLTDYYTTRITLISYPATSGYSVPSRQITLTDNSGSSEVFKIIPHPGFGLRHVQYQDHSNQKIDLLKDIDYFETDYVSGTESYKEVTISQSGWGKILGSDSRERIIFDFISANIKSTIKYTNSGNEYGVVVYGIDESSAPEYSNKVYLGELVVDGVSYTMTADIEHALENIEKDSTLEFTFYTLHDGSNFYRFSDIVVKKNESGELVRSSIEPIIETVENWGKDIMRAKFTITADCTEFFINDEISNTRVVTVDYFEDFEVRDIVSDVSYLGTYVTQFYSTFGDDLAYVKIGDIELNKDHMEEGDCRLEKNGIKYTLTITGVKENINIEIYNTNTQP